MNHKPECGFAKFEGPCICDRIELAEQRVRDNEINRAWLDGEEYGFADGVQAALKAVAALPVEWLRYEGGAWPHINHTAALAAIDALRGTE